MSADLPRPSRGHDSSQLEAGEFDFAGANVSASTETVGALAVQETHLLPDTEIDWTETVPAGPARVIRLTVELIPGMDVESCRRDFAELLRLLDEMDRVLGGSGLILDSSGCEETPERFVALLRPLDVRWCVQRFEQMALALEAEPTHPVAEPSVTTSNGRAQDPASQWIRRWREQQRWIQSCSVEVLSDKRS
jgi:hypothetical protein